MTKRFIAIFIILCILAAAVPVPAKAATGGYQMQQFSEPSNHSGVIASDNRQFGDSVWHYSGGYWMDANGRSRLNDSVNWKDAAELERVFYPAIKYTVPIPQSVKDEINAGNDVIISCEVNHDPSKMFYLNKEVSFWNDGNNVYFKAYPKLNFLYGVDYSSYVSGLNKFIPFMEEPYGLNFYSNYLRPGNSQHIGSSIGYLNPGNLWELPAPERGLIHPSKIANSSGNLASGFYVTVNNDGPETFRDSSTVNIGSGTFRDAGAVGLYLGIIVVFKFYRVINDDVAVTNVEWTEYKSHESVQAKVTVKNHGNRGLNTSVYFTATGNLDQSKSVWLDAGGSSDVYFYFNTGSPGTITLTGEVNRERAFTEKDYDNNRMSINAQVKDPPKDVAVTQILQTSYLGDQGVLAVVTVANNGERQITTSLNFSIPGITNQTETVTIPPYSSKDVKFAFHTPAGGSITMTAEANKERAFEEVNYNNNKLSVNAAITSRPPFEETTSCNPVIRWTETDRHTVDFQGPNGEARSYVCIHMYSYETSLTTSHTTDPKTFKSGYGFTVDVNCSISTYMAQHSGCDTWGTSRGNSKIPTPPSTVQVNLPWTVTNKLGTQSRNVTLDRTSATSTTSKFTPAANPISEIRARKIYTPVELAGTRDVPKSHSFSISISGGGVNGIEFCRTLNDSITINGSFYEDDITGAR